MSNRIQEWFEKMVRGLAKQGWLQALTSNGSRCSYRTANGMACAIGQIIPDNAPCITGNQTAHWLKEAGRLKDLGLGDISDEELYFLREAQGAHDDNLTPVRIKLAFTRMGERLRLAWPSDVEQLKEG